MIDTGWMVSGVLAGLFVGLVTGVVMTLIAITKLSKREREITSKLDKMLAIAMATAAASGVKEDHVRGVAGKKTQDLFNDPLAQATGINRTRKMKKLYGEGFTDADLEG